MSELFAVSDGIEQSGDAVLDEFAARAEIRGDDGTSPGKGFEDGFAKSLVGVGGKDREAASGNEFVELFAVEHPSEKDLFQVQISHQRLQTGVLGAVSGDYERDVRQLHHGAQKFVDAFLGREAAKVKQVALVGDQVRIGGEGLVMLQDFDTLRGETGGDQLAAYEVAGSEEHVHAAIVGAQPFVEIGFGGENDRA